jgi:hypothetical protein
MRGINDRFATIVKLIDDDRIYLPYTVVHAAERVDYSFAGRTPHSAAWSTVRARRDHHRIVW